MERLPALMTEGVFPRCTLAKSGVLVAHQHCLSMLAPAPCMTQMSETPCRASEQEMWFGQLRLLFAFTCGGQEYTAAFTDGIRWYEAVPNGHQRTGRAPQAGPVAARNATRMQRLKWATVRVGGQSRDWYGCVYIASILRPAFIQPDPTTAEHCFYNHFMR